MGFLKELFTFHSTEAFDARLLASLRPPEDIEDVIARYEDMISRGEKPSPEEQSHLCLALCDSVEEEELRKGIRILDELLQEGVLPERYTYNKALCLYRLGEYEEAAEELEIFERMNGATAESTELMECVRAKHSRDARIGYGILVGGLVTLAGVGVWAGRKIFKRAGNRK